MKDFKFIFEKYTTVKDIKAILEVEYDKYLSNNYKMLRINAYLFNTRIDDIEETMNDNDIKKYFNSIVPFVKWNGFTNKGITWIVENTLFFAMENKVFDFHIKSPIDLIKDLYFFNVPRDFIINRNKYIEVYKELFPDLTYEITINRFQAYRNQNNIDERKLYKEYARYKNLLELKQFEKIIKAYNKKLSDLEITIKKGNEYKEKKLNKAREYIMWANATEEDLLSKDKLLKHNEKLIREFETDLQKLYKILKEQEK